MFPKKNSLVKSPCFKVTQEKHEFLVTKLPALILTKISYASVLNIDTEPGAVQRMLNQNRIDEIKSFVLDDGDCPASVVLNWKDSKLLNVRDGTLSFTPASRMAQQLDGQHRVEGLREAIAVNPKVANMEIPVVIYQELDTTACADIFLTINSKQKPVARSVVTDLFGVASSYIIDVGGERARDIADLLNTREDSPYKDLVKYANMSRSPGVPISTIVDNVKDLVKPGAIFPNAKVDVLVKQSGPARTLGNLGRLAPSLIDLYTELRDASLGLTEDERWRRLNTLAWTRSLATSMNWKIRGRTSIRSIRWSVLWSSR